MPGVRTTFCALLAAAVLVIGCGVTGTLEGKPFHYDLVVRGGTVVDGTGAPPRPADVAVRGDRIAAIGDLGAATADTVVDAAGKTVIPGLIDGHVHLLLRGSMAVPQPASDAELERHVAEELPGKLADYLAHGITTVLDAGDFHPGIVALRDRLRSGDLAGPRLVVVGPLFTSPGGHPAATVCDPGNAWCREHLTIPVDSPNEAEAAVARLADDGVDGMKVVWDDLGMEGVTELSPEVVRALVEAGHGAGLEVMVHVVAAPDALQVVHWRADRLAHVPMLSGDPGLDETLLAALRDRRVTAATTLASLHFFAEQVGRDDPQAAQVMERVVQGVEGAVAALAGDGLLVLGTDVPELPPGEAFHDEVAALSAAGVTPHQILQAATRNAAVHAGREDELGTLEAGKLADLVVLDGNPLEDPTHLRRVETVIQGGRVVVVRRVQGLPSG